MYRVNIYKLLRGRVDLALEDELVAKASIKSIDPSILDQIEFVDPPLRVNEIHIVSGYKNPKHKDIIESFNKGIAQIKSNGIYDTIMQSYHLE